MTVKTIFPFDVLKNLSTQTMNPRDWCVIIQLILSRNTRTGRSNPSMEKLAKNTNLSISSVRRSILSLNKAKLIISIRLNRFSSAHHFFTYDLLNLHHMTNGSYPELLKPSKSSRESRKFTLTERSLHMNPRTSVHYI